MARKPRVHFPGALYHVMARGNQGQAIFTDDFDRRRYLELLQESQRRYNFRLYAYVLMGNHVHHIIQVGQTPLAKVMQNILFRYTRYWNAKYKKKGSNPLLALGVSIASNAAGGQFCFFV